MTPRPAGDKDPAAGGRCSTAGPGTGRWTSYSLLRKVGAPYLLSQKQGGSSESGDNRVMGPSGFIDAPQKGTEEGRGSQKIKKASESQKGRCLPINKLLFFSPEKVENQVLGFNSLSGRISKKITVP